MGSNIRKILEVLEFASWHHRFQRRKGYARIPYINHPIRVARLIAEMNEDPSEEILLAAILHDVVEDTEGTIEEIRQQFGKKTASIVAEVTDDMSLPLAERRKKQIEKAPHLSPEARQIKIADKICNIIDITTLPIDWNTNKKRKYIEWARQVAEGCRGINSKLDKYFDETCRNALIKI